MIRLIQRRLIIPRGDTGKLSIPMLPTENGANAAIFTIFNCLLHRKVFEAQMTLSDGMLTYDFSHEDTVNLPVGEYRWDIKFYSNAQFVDGVLTGGTEVNSYYAAFSLPVCEIRETGDNLLMADDAPDSTLRPGQIKYVEAAIAEMEQIKKDTTEQADIATDAAADAAEAAASIQQDLNNKADKTDTLLYTTLSRGRKDETTAGVGSVAFGLDVEASGFYSQAVGNITVASGNYASAEGQHTTASSLASHAEGDETVASGSYAHAEGLFGQATAAGAHAEGYNGRATGDYSHAEGQQTTASGGEAHSEGFYTVAAGSASHAEGRDSKAYALGSHAEGYDTIVTQSGMGAHAEGYRTIATAEGTHAEGEFTQAVDEYAHAEGYTTLASGEASHAEGNLTKAVGHNAHAEGRETTAAGPSSHAEGSYTVAANSNDHAEGNTTTAQGESSHAEGYHTTANGYASHAEGYYTIANGRGAHASGNYNVASVPYTAWTSGTSYVVGDKVTQYGTGFECIVDNTDTRWTEAHWKELPSSVDNIFIVGNGTSENNRSNALELGQNGDLAIQGDLTLFKGTANEFTVSSLKEMGAMVVDFDVDAATNTVTTTTAVDDIVNAYELKKPVYSHAVITSAEENTVELIGSMKLLSQEAISIGAGGQKTTIHMAIAEFTVLDSYLWIIGMGMAGQSEWAIRSMQPLMGASASIVDRPTQANAAGMRISNIGTPTAATDATTKKYVDDKIPKKVSQLTNDAGYITGYTETDPTVPAWAKTVNKPSYTAAEVGATTSTEVASMIAEAIGDIHSFDILVVEQLPEQDIQTHTIYFVPKTGDTSDSYDEYIYVNNAWEKIGNTQVDLSNYALKTDTVLNTTLSMGRKANTTVGSRSTVLGADNEASGAYSFATGYNTKASGYAAHAEGSTTEATGAQAHTEGAGTTASMQADHAEGTGTTAQGGSSHAEGSSTHANGNASHAEGQNTTASGMASHAEGNNTEATNVMAHAEGYTTHATGIMSHTEGNMTTASGTMSHAEGSESVASGQMSHAEGNNTIANASFSHAGGLFNKAMTLYPDWTANTAYEVGDRVNNSGSGYECITANNDATWTAAKWKALPSNSDTAFVIGNGNITTRSNAMELKWNGDMALQGDMTLFKGTANEFNVSSLKDAGGVEIFDFNMDRHGAVTTTATVADIVAAAEANKSVYGHLIMAGNNNMNIENYAPLTATKAASIMTLVLGKFEMGEVEVWITGQIMGSTETWGSNYVMTMRASGDNNGGFPESYNAASMPIKNLGAPTDNTDAATKKYVDDRFGGAVTDVQVNGTSIVTNGVANVPLMSVDGIGAAKLMRGGGIGVLTSGALYISTPTETQIKTGVDNYRPITPVRQNAAAFYGLAKAAGDTTQSQSSNAVGTYTPEAKAAIKEMLGVQDGLKVVRLI